MKNNSKTFILSLLIVIFIANIATAIGPALADIGNHFPNVSKSQLQLMSSIAAIASFVGALGAGKLQDYIKVKTVLLIGAIFTGIGALPVLFHNSFFLLNVVAIFIGLGSGLLRTSIPAIIASNFKGEEKAKMMGVKTGVQGLGSMSMTLLAGAAATLAWYYAYIIFLPGVIAFVVVLLLLPSTPVVKKEKQALQETKEDELKFHANSLYPVLLLVLGFWLSLFSAVMVNNMSLHVAGNQIGDAKVAGFALTMMNAGTILAGFMSSRIVKLTKNNTLILGYLTMAIGLIGISALKLAIPMHLFSFIFGMGYGLVMTRLLYTLSAVLKTTSVAKGMGLFSAFLSLGFAFSPIIVNQMTPLFNNLGNLASVSFLVGSMIAIIIAAVLVLTRFEMKLYTKVGE